MDLERIERAVREILLAVGEDPEREGLEETPARVARMYAEIFSGLQADPKQHLKFFDAGGCIRSASITCCRLSANATSPISRKTGGSSGFRSLPALWNALRAARRCRSA